MFPITTNFRRALLVLLAVACVFTACDKSRLLPGKNFSGTESTLVMWVHSDIQPHTPSQYWHYETAVKDMARHLTGVTMAIVAGDIVQFSKSPQDYEWFLKTREGARVPYWFEIAGNHDAKDFPTFQKYFTRPLHYAVTVGNILIVLMSDEQNSPDTDISPLTFEWWKNLVVNNQDRILITVTHAHLKESNLAASSIYTMIIKDGERFAEVLKKYRVDVWISGHTHMPYYVPGRTNAVPELNGTLFMDVASIKKDFFLDTIDSRILIFERGSNVMKMRVRDHEKHQFVQGLDVNHPLGRAFDWDGSPPVVLEQ